EQMNTLKNSGLPDPQIGMVAQLAKISGKPIENIVKMKTEQDMGWGEIAKSLGVSPKEIGLSVSENKKKKDPESKITRREERRTASDERREERRARREDRRSERQDRKEDRRSDRDSHGH